MPKSIATPAAPSPEEKLSAIPKPNLKFLKKRTPTSPPRSPHNQKMKHRLAKRLPIAYVWVDEDVDPEIRTSLKMLFGRSPVKFVKLAPVYQGTGHMQPRRLFQD
jgi:hypothetical protein